MKGISGLRNKFTFGSTKRKLGFYFSLSVKKKIKASTSVDPKAPGAILKELTETEKSGQDGPAAG